METRGCGHQRGRSLCPRSWWKSIGRHRYFTSKSCFLLLFFRFGSRSALHLCFSTRHGPLLSRFCFGLAPCSFCVGGGGRGVCDGLKKVWSAGFGPYLPFRVFSGCGEGVPAVAGLGGLVWDFGWFGFDLSVGFGFCWQIFSCGLDGFFGCFCLSGFFRGFFGAFAACFHTSFTLWSDTFLGGSLPSLREQSRGHSVQFLTPYGALYGSYLELGGTAGAETS